MSCLCVLTNITYQDIFIFPEIHIVTLFMVYVILQHFNDFPIEKYNAGFASFKKEGFCLDSATTV